MATRLYGTASAPDATPAVTDAIGTPTYRRAVVGKEGAQEVVTIEGGSDEIVVGPVWVSPRLGAQTISGTATCAVFVTGAASATPAASIWVANGTTGAARGVLLARTNLANPGGTETAEPFAAGAVALTPVAAQAGDYLVVEFIAAHASHFGTIPTTVRYGGTGADATPGSTTTSQASWVEFSATVLFAAPSVRVQIVE